MDLIRQCRVLFEAWRGGGCEAGTSCLQVRLSSDVPEGRGLVAERIIRKGEALLHVPEHILITPDAALRSSSIGLLQDALNFLGQLRARKILRKCLRLCAAELYT